MSDHPLDSNVKNGEGEDLSDATRHTVEAGIGAASGGAIGAIAGSAIAGKKGGLVGGLVGAIAGALVGETVGDDLIALEQQAAEVLGEAATESEPPAHYTWEQLQQLSKPQASPPVQ